MRRRPTTPLADTGFSPVTRVTLRYAAAADGAALELLAALDCGARPDGPALVAEVDGRLRAALPLDGGPAIADPSHSGCELLDLLRLRALQLSDPPAAQRPLSARPCG